ncbi:MAG: hypothetical protein V4456_09975 [Bacteroidota bacterium]
MKQIYGFGQNLFDSLAKAGEFLLVIRWLKPTAMSFLSSQGFTSCPLRCLTLGAAVLSEGTAET